MKRKDRKRRKRKTRKVRMPEHSVIVIDVSGLDKLVIHNFRAQSTQLRITKAPSNLLYDGNALQSEGRSI